LLKWILNYLAERKKQVVVSGETLSCLPVAIASPQAILGPLDCKENPAVRRYQEKVRVASNMVVSLRELS